MARKSKTKSNEDILRWLLSSKSVDQLKKAKFVIENLLEFRKVGKLFKTYISGVKRAMAYNEEDKVYFEFKLASTVTGRLSCSSYKAGAKKPKGVSLHTLPRESEFNIRSIFKAPEGYDFIVVDQKTMELRVLAHIANEKGLLRAFQDKEDVHSSTAKGIFGKSEVTKEERQVGKTVAFTIVYGGTEYNIAEKNKVSIERATQILSKFKQVYPNVFKYMDKVYETISKDGSATTIFQRKRNLPNIYSPVPGIRSEAIRQGVNFTIQSPASDILLCAAIGVWRDFKKENIDGWLIGTVHDSLECVVRKKDTERAIEIIKHHMVNYPLIKEKFGMQFKVPFEIDIEVGRSFGEVEKI